jgi:hypothetical protein
MKMRNSWKMMFGMVLIFMVTFIGCANDTNDNGGIDNSQPEFYIEAAWVKDGSSNIETLIIYTGAHDAANNNPAQRSYIEFSDQKYPDGLTCALNSYDGTTLAFGSFDGSFTASFSAKFSNNKLTVTNLTDRPEDPHALWKLSDFNGTYSKASYSSH